MRKSPPLFRPALAVSAMVIGCAACCAFPLLATIGLVGASTGVAAWLAGHAVLASFGVAIVIAVLGIAWNAIARRREPTVKCAQTCEASGGCCSKAG